MDQSSVEAYLQRIRAAGDASIKPCSLILPAMRAVAAQRVGTAHLFLRPRFLLADPTGTGKTPTALAAYAYLKEKDPSLQLLVVTTRSAQFQWARSAARFLDPSLRVEVIGHRANKVRMPPAERLARYATLANTDIWVTTYATLALDETRFLQGLDNYVLVLDEAHWVKSYKQDKLYPAALHVSEKARACWGLSATPVANDRFDELFSLMEIIRPNTFGTGDIQQRYSQFRRSYYVMRLVKPQWKDKRTGQKARPYYEVIGTQNVAHLQGVIDPFYLRRPKAVFDAQLPDELIRIDDVLLDAKQRKLYDEVWSLKWPGPDGEPIKRIQALTYAQQALAAPELLGKPDVPNAKLSALLDLLKTEFRDEKVVVYTHSVEVLKVVSAALTTAQIQHGSIYGALSTAARDAAVQKFHIDARARVMLITDAGGEAVDLQAAGVLVLFDLPWSHGKLVQVRGRVHRIGSQHASVLTVLLVAPNTLDETIAQQLSRKENSIRTLITQGNAITDTTLDSILPTLSIDFDSLQRGA